MGDRQPQVVVFLDRDGVINRDRTDYVKSLAELEILPGVPAAIARLRRAGIIVYVTSNQAGIAKKLLTVETLGEITRTVANAVHAEGEAIDGFFYCPHVDADNCDCRKPKVGLFARALESLEHTPELMYVVGDSARDLEAGRRIGARTVLVLSGKLDRGASQALASPPDLIADNLTGAVELILGELGLDNKEN